MNDMNTKVSDNRSRWQLEIAINNQHHLSYQRTNNDVLQEVHYTTIKLCLRQCNMKPEISLCHRRYIYEKQHHSITIVPELRHLMGRDSFLL